jgi:hypothetical protein
MGYQVSSYSRPVYENSEPVTILKGHPCCSCILLNANARAWPARSLRLGQRIIVGFVKALDFAAVEALVSDLQRRTEGFWRA